MKILGIPFLRSRHLPRFILVCGGLMILTVLAMCVTAIVWLRQQAITDTEARLVQLNLALAEQVERSFGAIETVQETISSVAQRGDLFEASTRARMHAYLANQSAALPQVQAFLVMDRNGDLVIDSTSPEPRIYNGADRENFQSLREGKAGDMHIGAPLFGRLARVWLFTVSRRLETADGQFAGIISGNVDLSYFVDFFSAMKLGEDGVISLWRRDGVYLMGSPFNEKMIGRVVNQGRIHKEFLPYTDEAVLREASPVDGSARLISFHALKSYSAFVVVSRSMDAVLTPWRKQAIALGIFSGLAVLVLMGIGYVLMMMARAQDRLLLAAHEARAEAEYATKAAEKANGLRSKFFAGISHDLRSPLGAISGFSELLLGGYAGALTEKARGYAADIQASSSHLLELINDLLDMAKAEAGHLQIEDDEFALFSVVGECLRLSGAQAEEAQVTLAPYDERDIGLRADALRLRQILINLLSNAIKFTPPGGRVEISTTHAQDGTLRIAVSDTGIGLDKAELATALEPYGQVINDFTRTRQGTGLGLPMVKMLAELHGGWLDVQSAPGKGSTFTVVFPAERVLPMKSDLRARVA